MTIQMLQKFFLWCLIINSAMLLWWVLIIMVAGNWVYKLHGRWFKLSREQFSSLHYMGMAIYKMLIFLLNLAPWLALLIIGRSAG